MNRVLLFAFLLFCQTAIADDSKFTPRHVQVTGTSIAHVQPDTVVWHIVVRRTNRDLAKAQAECEATVKKILELPNELKIAPENVQTGYLSIHKIYDRDAAGNQTSFRHFQIERTIMLKQKDTTRFDAILASLIASSDIEVSYSLESSQYHTMRTKTRLEAVRAAKLKAVEMTELLGAKLGRVLSIEEPDASPPSPLAYGASNSVFIAPRAAEPDQSGGSFAPGTIEIRVSIEVAFEIE